MTEEPERNDRTNSRPWPWRLAAFSVLFLLPLALRQIPIDHGMPRNYLPDTHVVRQALGMARDKDPAPQVGTYSTYPNLIAYSLLPVYAGQYFTGRALGEWSGSGEYANAIKEDPGRAHLPARRWLGLLTALASFFLYRAGRAAGLQSGALAAGVFGGTSLLFLQLSLHERPWGPLAALTALALWPAVRHARYGKTRDLVWCAIAAGLCIATHQAGGLVLGLAGLAWAFAPSAGGAERGAVRWLRGRFLRGAVAVALFVVVGVLLGYGHVLLKAGTEAVAVSGEDLNVDSSLKLGGQMMPSGLQLESFPRMVSAFFGYDPVLLVFGVLGAFAAWKRRALRPVVLFALLWAAVFTTNKNDYVRYLVPLVPVLALTGGALCEKLAERVQEKTLALAGLALVAFGFPLLQSARLCFVLSQPDTRALAEAKLQELPESAVVAIDRYGPDVPLDLAALERLERLRRPATLRSRETHRRILLEEELFERAGPDVNALRVEEVLEFPKGEKPAVREAPEGNATREAIEGMTDPLDALRALGCTHLLSVTRRPGKSDETLPVPVGDPLWTIHPSEKGGRLQEALLPLVTDGGWRALWQVDRPGPLLRLLPL